MIAAVCYRRSHQVIEFLLVRSSSGRWTLPEGSVAPDEMGWEAAAREAFERAGATGRSGRDPFTTLPMGGTHGLAGARGGVAVYLLPVERRQRPALRHREPTWFASEDAERVLTAGRRPAEAAELRRLVREACRVILEGDAPA